MIVLDENISGVEEAKLLRWRIRCRTIGVHIATKGTDDGDLIPVLLALPRPIFCTHDKDFWNQAFQHSAYCLVWLDTEETEQARYIRAFLRHSDFDTHAKRLGKIVRAHPDGLTFYESRHGKAKQVAWLRAV